MANSIAYGTITISDLSDGAQIWTTTVAPTTPNYTFTKTDLNTDGSVDIKVGDLIFYDVYRYTVTSIGETTVLGSYRTNMRGTGIWKITTAPTNPSATVQGTYPDAVYVIKRTTAISESGANEILVGDILEYDTYHYPVLHNDSSSSYIILGERVNFKGANGRSVISVTSTNNTDSGGTSIITVTYSEGNPDTFYVKNGGTAEWYYGTALTHTTGSATLATSSTDGVVVGAMYLNPNTSLVYKCTNISGSNATWTYAGDITTGVLENIEVGGRNLSTLKNMTLTDGVKTFTKNSGKTWFTPTAVYPLSDYGLSLVRSSTTDDIFSLSFDWTAETVDADATIGAYLRSSSTGYSSSGMTWINIEGNVLTVGETCSGHFKGRCKLTSSVINDYGDKWLFTINTGTSNNSTKLYVSHFMFEKATIGSTWSLAPEDVESTITAVQTLAQAAKDSADGKVTTFYQSGTPTANAIGDLWIDTTDSKNSLKRWDGSSWVVVDNADLQTALTNAATAQATADGKIVTFAQASSPTATDVGDIWIDTDDNNKLYRWNGSAWVDVAADVDVGGTNLWVSNAGTFGYLASNGTLTLSSSVHHIASTMRRYIPVTAGERFVYQHWNPTLINDTTNYGQVAFYNSSKTHIKYTDGTTGSGNYELPKVSAANGDYVVRYFVAPPNAAFMRIGLCYANGMYDFRAKVERGNTPTAYSPAPEDIEAQAAGTSSPNLCTHTKNPKPEDVVRTSEATVLIGDDGTITLQPGSSATYVKWKSYIGGGIPYSECNGNTYSVSFDAKRGTSESYTNEKQMLVYMGINAADRYETQLLHKDHDYYRAQYTNVFGNWKRYRCSFVVPSTFATGTNTALVDTNYLVVQFGAESAQVPIIIKNIKLELGDLATEYAPAQEDTDNAINDAQHAADVANDTAQQALDDASTANTGLQSLKDNEIAALFDYVDTSTSAISTLNGELTGYKETADERLAALEAYDEVVGGHINIVDNNNEYYIDIGKQKKTAGVIHDFHLKLEGDRMVFYDGDTAMAYFHNSQLYAPDAIFATRAKIGNFAFVPRTTGNLSFMYVGGSE